MIYLDRRRKKALNEAYDKLQELDNLMGDTFGDALEIMEEEAKKHGYKFQVNQRSQKFRMYIIKEGEQK